MELSSDSHNNKGFTLLELLIAIVILAFISLGIFQATTNSFRLRDILMIEGDFYNEIRISMAMLENDISLIYSPKLMAPPKQKKSKTSQNANDPFLSQNPSAARAAPQVPVSSNFWLEELDPTGIRHSRFIGEEDSLSFVTSSHRRIYRESKESIFSKITYVLKDDDKAKGEMEDTKVLVKTENTNAFDLEKDDDDALKSFPLLRGIKTIKFQYYSKEKDEWYRRWDSESQDFRFKIPDLIEVEISIVGEERHNFDGRYRFRPEVPIEGIETTS